MDFDELERLEELALQQEQGPLAESFSAAEEERKAQELKRQEAEWRDFVRRREEEARCKKEREERELKRREEEAERNEAPTSYGLAARPTVQLPVAQAQGYPLSPDEAAKQSSRQELQMRQEERRKAREEKAKPDENQKAADFIDPMADFCQRLMERTQERLETDKWLEERLGSSAKKAVEPELPEEPTEEDEELLNVAAMLAALDKEEQEERELQEIRHLLPDLAGKGERSLMLYDEVNQQHPWMTAAVRVFQERCPEVDLDELLGAHYDNVLRAAAHHSPGEGYMEVLQHRLLQLVSEEKARRHFNHQRIERHMRGKILEEGGRRALGHTPDTAKVRSSAPSSSSSAAAPRPVAEPCFPGMGGLGIGPSTGPNAPVMGPPITFDVLKASASSTPLTSKSTRPRPPPPPLPKKVKEYVAKTNPAVELELERDKQRRAKEQQERIQRYKERQRQKEEEARKQSQYANFWGHR